MSISDRTNVAKYQRIRTDDNFNQRTAEHARAIDKKQYERVVSLKEHNQSCKGCKNKEPRKFLLWCKFHEKQIKHYNICAHWR